MAIPVGGLASAENGHRKPKSGAGGKEIRRRSAARSAGLEKCLTSFELDEGDVSPRQQGAGEVEKGSIWTGGGMETGAGQPSKAHHKAVRTVAACARGSRGLCCLRVFAAALRRGW